MRLFPIQLLLLTIVGVQTALSLSFSCSVLSIQVGEAAGSAYCETIKTALGNERVPIHAVSSAISPPRPADFDFGLCTREDNEECKKMFARVVEEDRTCRALLHKNFYFNLQGEDVSSRGFYEEQQRSACKLSRRNANNETTENSL